jgi:hypothetical protein
MPNETSKALTKEYLLIILVLNNLFENGFKHTTNNNSLQNVRSIEYHTGCGSETLLVIFPGMAEIILTTVERFESPCEVRIVKRSLMSNAKMMNTTRIKAICIFVFG